MKKVNEPVHAITRNATLSSEETEGPWVWFLVLWLCIKNAFLVENRGFEIPRYDVPQLPFTAAAPSRWLVKTVVKVPVSTCFTIKSIFRVRRASSDQDSRCVA